MPTDKINKIISYAFSAKGKMLRPLLVLLMSACANGHHDYSIIGSHAQISGVKFSDRKLGSCIISF